MCTRREFLHRAATIGAVGMAGGITTNGAFALQTQARTDGRLIFLFLRGAMDGLFTFAPVTDPQLAQVRPTLSVKAMNEGIRLGSTGFAAHPSAKIFADLFASRELSFAPSAGTTDASRSHFQAQDLFEFAAGGAYFESGFMARAAQALGNNGSVISFTRDVPVSLRGLESPQVAPLTGSGLKMPEGKVLTALRAAHKGVRTGDAIEQAIATDQEITQAMDMDGAARGAIAAQGFAQTAGQMGRVLRNNLRMNLAFLDLGGWDTHAGQEGILSRNLQSVGEGLLALKENLGATEWRRTQVLIMTEFGRTVRENGTQGTDHGHGSLALLAGGAIDGGRMIGDFKGLAQANLNENRDLPVLVDWRSLLARSLQQTVGLKDNALRTVLPGLPRMA